MGQTFYRITEFFTLIMFWFMVLAVPYITYQVIQIRGDINVNPSDINRDGVVDITDVSILLSEFGVTDTNTLCPIIND
jgi:hypothetical protein